MANIEKINVNGTTYDIKDSISGYVTSSSLATVATSGSYSDLSNKPTIPTITYGTADPTGGSNGDIYIKYEV